MKKRSGPNKFLLIVALLLLAAVIAVRMFVRKPQIPASDPASAVSTAEPADSASVSSAPEEDLPAPRERKDDFFTILVSGMDDDNGGSDTNILIGFDAKNGTIRGVSIPRDSGVWFRGKSHKINVASKYGVDSLADTLSDTLGIPVDFTVQVNLKGFQALVDAIGGVDFNVPIDMNYDDPLQNLSIHFKAGTQHLDGAQALRVVRFRQNNDGTGYGNQDIGRVATQQKFLKAVAKKMISNPGKIPEYVRIFAQHVDTNLSAGELAWLGEQAVLAGTDAIEFDTLPGAWSGRRSLYLLDADAVVELVNEALNPYTTDLTAEDMNLLA